MPRNMIAANRALFTALAAAAGEEVSQNLRDQVRAIRTSAEEKRWLQRSTFRTSSHLFLGPTARIALSEYKQEVFAVVIGFDVVNPPEEFTIVELNAGLFTAVVSELNVPILRTTDLSERLREFVFYPSIEQVELLDLAVVRPFFEQITVFRIERGSAIALDDELGLRAGIAAILGAPNAVPLQLPDSTVARLHFMIRDPDERAPFHLLFRAITEVRDEATFLAIYRCVEQLFPIPAISELSTALGLTAPALEIAATIEHHLGWRRREEDAIAHLFSDLATALIERLAPVVGVVGMESSARRVAKRVYELRNQCVHYRPVHASDGAALAVNWMQLSDLMLEVVQVLYARHRGAFMVAEAVTA